MKTLHSLSGCGTVILRCAVVFTQLVSGQSQKWVVNPSSKLEGNTKLYAETVYYNAEKTVSVSTGNVTRFTVREDRRLQDDTNQSGKDNPCELYKPAGNGSYHTIYRNASGEKIYESGMLEFSTGNIDEPIPDLEFWDYLVRTDLTLPGDAYVTNVEYRLRISYIDEPTSFACEDYDIYLYSERELPYGLYYNVYNNLGSLTDGGFDDDADDDRDIYLNWRSTDYFNGVNPSGWWGGRVEDNMVLYSGKIDYFSYRIYWETPKPNLTFTNPPGWAYPIVASSVSGTNTDGPDLIAGETTYVDMTYTLEDQTLSGPFKIAMFIDGDLHDTWNIVNPSTGTYPNEDYEVVLGHGNHDVCVSLDEYEDIDESDEYDNLYCRTFYFRYPAPSTPSLTLPADGSGCESLPVLLDWSDADYTNHYRLQVDDNEDFSSVVINDETPEVSYASVTGLNENTVYYWRVQALNVDGSSAWSAVRNFSTGHDTPENPELISPANNSEDQSTSVTLSWEEVDFAESYLLMVDETDDFTSPLFDESGITVNSFALSSLENQTTYYWKVKAVGNCSSGDWSEVWEFETEEITVPSALTDVVIRSYVLEQNYPNPFMKTTTIGFALPAEGEVSIEFMDMQGKVIESISGYYPAGSHSITLNREFQPGVYIYRMKVNEFIDSKLCIVR